MLLSACGGGGSGGSPEPPAPVITAVDDLAATNQGVPVTVDVLANDSGITASSVALASPPAGGTIERDGPRFVYSPEPDFFGIDEFAYSAQATDGRSLTARVTINVNAAPIAQDAIITGRQNERVALNGLIDASVDPDGTLASATLSIIDVALGEANDDGYLPPVDFEGEDTLTFRIADEHGAVSNVATATIEVAAITNTRLLVATLPVPTSGYQLLNLTEFDDAVLASPSMPIVDSANGNALLLTLSGEDVGREDGLQIVDITSPGGSLGQLGREVIVCDEALCSAYLPRLPEKGTPERGTWQVRIGTTAPTLAGIDFSDVRMQVVERRGPAVQLDARNAITVRPVLTASSLTPARFDEILSLMKTIAANNGIELRIRPPRIITDPMFEEVSSSFLDPVTQALIRQGDADAANLFFIESFTGSGGRIGIAAGIPGELAAAESYLNGVIINATVTMDDPAIHARTTAEFALHEMGHLLGLFHTTEASFDHDVLTDTPRCTRADDRNSNSRPETFECPDGLNLMFWTNDFDRAKAPLTEDQKFVLFHSPMATPEGPPLINPDDLPF